MNGTPLDELVRQLDLAPHPEGGFYRETYRATQALPADALRATHGGARAASTAIYFLVPRGTFSALHRIASDEVWHFYAGAPLEVVSILPSGAIERQVLGLDLRRGHRPQHVVHRGAWFGSRVADEGAEPWSLVGCTVAPGFDFADFELADRTTLTAAFPDHTALIASLTRDGEPTVLVPSRP